MNGLLKQQMFRGLAVVCLSIFLLMLTSLSQCQSKDQQEDIEADKILSIMVSILPQSYFTETIGGDKVKVQVMIPNGANPATYEPLPSQMAALSQADVYIKLGSPLPFERTYMESLTEINDEMKMIDCSKGIQIVDNDPHIWLSPVLAQTMVNNIYEGLVEIDPDNQSYYQTNKEQLIKDLSQLHEEILQIFADFENPHFLIFHPAFGYFAREYGLDQIAIEEEGHEPSSLHIEEIIQYAKENAVEHIFASVQFSQASAQAISDEIEGEVILIDPLAYDYIENLKSVANKIASTLQ